MCVHLREGKKFTFSNSRISFSILIFHVPIFNSDSVYSIRSDIRMENFLCPELFFILWVASVSDRWWHCTSRWGSSFRFHQFCDNYKWKREYSNITAYFVWISVEYTFLLGSCLFYPLPFTFSSNTFCYHWCSLILTLFLPPICHVYESHFCTSLSRLFDIGANSHVCARNIGVD